MPEVRSKLLLSRTTIAGPGTAVFHLNNLPAVGRVADINLIVVLCVGPDGAVGNSMLKSACAVPRHILNNTPNMPMSRLSCKGARLKSRYANFSSISKCLRNDLCTESKQSRADGAAWKIAPLHYSIWLRTCVLKSKSKSPIEWKRRQRNSARAFGFAFR